MAFFVLSSLPVSLRAQWLPYYPASLYPHLYADTCTASDTLVLPKWEPHLSVSTGFMGTSYGDNRLFTSVAPSLVYRPSDKC